MVESLREEKKIFKHGLTFHSYGKVTISFLSFSSFTLNKTTRHEIKAHCQDMKFITLFAFILSSKISKEN